MQLPVVSYHTALTTTWLLLTMYTLAYSVGARRGHSWESIGAAGNAYNQVVVASSLGEEAEKDNKKSKTVEAKTAKPAGTY